MSTTRLVVVHARSPLHAGTGQASAAVDLPIARDRATRIPLLPGSSLKGALRARSRQVLNGETTTIFGPETENASDHAGAVAFTDVRLLLLPVRSVAGTFAWVTSPYALASFARDAALAGFARLPAVPKVSAEGVVVSKSSMLEVMITKKDGPAKKVVLEEFDLNIEPVEKADGWAAALAPLVFPGDATWADLFTRRLCVVHDDTMSFLCEHGTEIVTRVSIDPHTGTAKDGQLWTEENLPAESVLFGLAEELPYNRKDRKPGALLDTVQSKLLDRPIQLGGKATVGRGRCSVHLAKGGN